MDISVGINSETLDENQSREKWEELQIKLNLVSFADQYNRIYF